VEGAPPPDEQESSAFATTTQTASAKAGGGSEALHQDTAGGVSLESFDYSTFDPTSPSSWEALGKAWAATNGRQPLQEELMMFVMEFTVSMANQALPGGPATQANNQWTTTGQGQRWMGDPPSRGCPPRGGRGRGGASGSRGGRRGFYSGSGGNGRAEWEYGGDGYGGYADANGTDAIVLGEHTNDIQSSQAQDAPVHEQVSQAGPGQGEEGDGQTGSQGATTGTGGRMQKVGDNWVFVRNDGSS
jgi:protein NRD1